MKRKKNKFTIIHKGDYFTKPKEMINTKQSFSFLFDKDKNPRNVYFLDRQEQFILSKCPLFNYGQRTKNRAVIQFFTRLLEKNDGKTGLNCWNAKKYLNEIDSIVPTVVTCHECPYYAYQVKELKNHEIEPETI